MKFQKVDWGEKVRAEIAPAFSLYPGELEAMLGALESGEIAVYRLDDLGHILVKLIQHSGFREFYVVAACGRELKRAAMAIEAKAYWHDFNLVTWRTRRKGIARMASVIGYQVNDLGDEWECKKWVKVAAAQTVAKAQVPK